MTVIYGLLALAIVVAAGLVALLIGELRWEARNRLSRCTTCGRLHHRHAPHR
jgi:hypothetical protein